MKMFLLVVLVALTPIVSCDSGHDGVKKDSTWQVIVYGPPTYNYQSVTRRSSGYSSLEACLRVGSDISLQLNDSRVWFQCGYSCEFYLKYGGEWVCDKVCERTGDCRN